MKHRTGPSYSLVYSVLLFGLLLLLIGTAPVIYLARQRHQTELQVIRRAELTIQGITRETVLPCTLDNLPHGTEVELSFTLPASPDTLFFGTVYAPLQVYAGGRRLYSCPTDPLPGFLMDPPTEYCSVPLPRQQNGQVIRMVYSSPLGQRSLKLPAPMAGTETAILHYLISRYGLPMFLSMFFISLGILLSFLSLFLLNAGGAGYAMIWPGLLALCAGGWQFAENPLTVFLLQQSSLLYILAFTGLFLLPVPLYKTAFLTLGMGKDPLLRFALYLTELSVLAALLLQLTGVLSFHTSIYGFHVLLPFCFFLLTLQVYRNAVKQHADMAVWFFASLLVLSCTALMEILNAHLHFLPHLSLLFQTGVFLSTVFMGIFCGVVSRSMFRARIQNLELKNNLALQQQAIEAQKQKNGLLLAHYEEVRKKRHDMRHHLRTMTELMNQQAYQTVSEYLQTITEEIPVFEEKRYCDNMVLNSTISYYSQLAETEQIACRIRVEIPAANPHVSDADLCVVFGNLLENAIEACRRVQEGSRFLRLSSQVSGDMLFISMDNSMAESPVQNEEGFFSTKHQGTGQGIRSVRSLAEHHFGTGLFTASENSFRSEVCLRL